MPASASLARTAVFSSLSTLLTMFHSFLPSVISDKSSLQLLNAHTVSQWWLGGEDQGYNVLKVTSWTTVKQLKSFLGRKSDEEE